MRLLERRYPLVPPVVDRRNQNWKLCDPFSHVFEKLTESDWEGGRWARIRGETMGAVEEGDNSESCELCGR
jgi:hypothetical protein